MDPETCVKFKLRTSIHSKQLSCMHERNKSFKTFRLIKMPGKKGKLNPQSLLALLNCYAENSSIHGRWCKFSQQRFVCLKEFSTCWRNLMPPGWLGRFWWSLVLWRPPSLPATSSSTGRMSGRSPAWRQFLNRWTSLTFPWWPSARTARTCRLSGSSWRRTRRIGTVEG